ncbi:MAG: hypothetical protein KBG40_05290 [Bacteroidales bacterium]|nr:hypothetical protein [Bacteroidales bacterium]
MKRKLTLILTSVIILTISCLLSCKRNPYKVNISGISLEVHIKRLEKDLFSIDPLKIPDAIQTFKQKYGDFLKYFGYVINIGEPDDSTWTGGLIRFCTDRLNNEVFNETMKVFPDVQFIEEELSLAFRYYKYYFPSKPVPAVFTCITGFNSSIIVGDSILGIGLDRYLGKDCKYYPMLGLYNYQIVKMTPEYVVPDAIYGWISSEWDAGQTSPDVLSEIIREGKLMYVKKCLLPDLQDEMIFGFTPEQMKFCRDNEGMMWQYLVENNILFSTDQLTIRKLTGEAPFTSYFTKESPGRAAVWIGFRIIESFMKNSRGMSVEEMMNLKDYQQILEKAKYSPQKL